MIVYTDGSSSLKTGCGGWAWTTVDGVYQQAGAGYGTNQQMELLAVCKALEVWSWALTLEIVSDSAYVVNCFKEGWFTKWEANGWRNSSGKPVANAELWARTIEVYHRRLRAQWKTTQFTKVKGHSKNPGNDLADKLAGAARRELEVQRGLRA